MKEFSFKLHLLGLLCSVWLPSTFADEYVVDADNDPIILDYAIALLVVCVVFLLCVIIVQLAIYKKIKDTKGLAKNYHVSYRASEANADRLGPFHGQAMYSRKNTNSIYLPGRQNVMGRAESKYGGIYDLPGLQVYEEPGVTRDSPPTEKGQRDSMVSEKTASRSSSHGATSYENEAYATAYAGASSFTTTS